MKYNNGDMEDLFRRASERYPLRTDSADWDRLASALDGEPAAPSNEREKRRRRGVFWWFLLIPLAGIGYWTWQMSGSRLAHVAQAVRAVKAGGVRDGKAGAAAGGAVNGGAGTAGSSVKGGGGIPTARTAADAGTSGRHTGDGRSTAVVDRSNLTEGSGNAVIVGEGARKRVKRSKGGKVDAAGIDIMSNDLKSGDVKSNDVRLAGMVSLDQDPMLALLDLRRAPIGERHPIDVDVVAPKVEAKITQPARKHPHGYIGVFGAPDFSTVRFQTMKGVGTTFGVLLGYSFNDRWAVETGLYLDRKNYYTAGEYFDTKKVTMPPGYTKLLNADGTCNMWEIPVNVRYNLNTNPRMKWFVTAGLSTYLMTSENYTYQVENNWSTEENYWNIHKPSQYWFSIVNLSAGFEQRVGKIGNLRLEPYVRIPLSGIGTGNLPILSAGLNIGFTRQLW